jgi:hypothetical protein
MTAIDNQAVIVNQTQLRAYFPECIQALTRIPKQIFRRASKKRYALSSMRYQVFHSGRNPSRVICLNGWTRFPGTDK